LYDPDEYGLFIDGFSTEILLDCPDGFMTFVVVVALLIGADPVYASNPEIDRYVLCVVTILIDWPKRGY
jgi:hypothetical protein